MEAADGVWLRQGGRLSSRQLQTMVRAASGDSGHAVECCPSRMETVSPLGGTNSKGEYVELFRSDDDQQSFFEVSCEESVVDQPCLFVDRRLQNQSKCVQKYSYSYALVREPLQDKWYMDHIRVRSGCSCEIAPKAKQRKRGGGGGKGKRRQKDT